MYMRTSSKNIGYACLIYGIKGYPLKSCTLKNIDKVPDIVEHNLDTLFHMLKYNRDNNIYLFRISSDIIPLASHSENHFDWKNVFKDKLIELGTFIREHRIRVSMHPGQYTVLNSNREDVVKKSVQDLEYHCDFLDALNLDSSHKIVLHIGGVYGDKDSAKKRFIDNFKLLSQNIKSRLIIENDDKSYNISDVLEISDQINIPVVFDNLHHHINPPDEDLSQVAWIKKANSTWKKDDGRQKIHYSQQQKSARVGSHSQTIAIDDFLDFYKSVESIDLDIMLEVKDKNLSAIKCILLVSDSDRKYLEVEWARYKYLVLYHSHGHYLSIRKLFSQKDIDISLDFYRSIEAAMSLEPSLGSMKNSLSHVWGYFKKFATASESKKYKSLMAKLECQPSFNVLIFKRFLYKLAIKYNTEYLSQSYFFYDI